MTGKEFRKLREGMSLTRVEFGKQYGVHHQAVMKYELGLTSDPYWLRKKNVQKLIAAPCPQTSSDVIAGETSSGQLLISTLVESKPVLEALLSRMSTTEVADMVGSTKKTIDLWVKEHAIDLKLSKKITAKQLAKDFGV